MRLRHNSGPAAARNAGLAPPKRRSSRSSTRTSSCFDGWLDGLLWHFDDPRVGFVAPRVASGPAAEDGDRRVARYEERHSPLDLGSEPARIAAGTRVSYVPAAALIVRKDALDEVGGFDTSLRCGEDVDAVWRLAAAGWRGRYEPSVVVHHQPRRTWRQLVAQRRPTASRRPPWRRCHGNAVAPVRMSPWTLGVWGLAASGRPLSAAGLAGATALALIPKLPGVPAGDSLRLAGAGHLAAGGALATAVRRVWMPLVGRRRDVVAAGSLGRRRLDSSRRSSAADRPACSTTSSYSVGVWKGVLGRRRLAPLLPALTSWPRSEDVVSLIGSRPSARGADLTLRLTVDTAAWRAHVDHVATSYERSPIVPVVKGNGYGFGRSVLARVAEDLLATPATGRHGADDRRRYRPRARRVYRRGCARSSSRRPVQPNDHRWQAAAHRPIVTIGDPAHIAALDGWRGDVLVKLASSMRRFGVAPRELDDFERQARVAGLNVVGHSIHLPLAGDDTERVAEVERWVTVLDSRHTAADTTTDVWVSHLGPDAHTALCARFPGRRFPIRLGTSLWHGDKETLRT